MGNWIVCQLGAREHYAVPRALHQSGALAMLVTDAWVSPSSPIGSVAAGLRERFHDDLAHARVEASNLGSSTFEMIARMRGWRGWRKVIARNTWFQRLAIKRLRAVPADDAPRTLFAYSYAASELFTYARSRGWRTVLGQIDPGLFEERLVAGLHRRSSLKCEWSHTPAQYWLNWHKECALADAVVVNSMWSRNALVSEGVSENKVVVLPLAMTPPAAARQFKRSYPTKFSAERPMRVLFLGQINLRKGIEPLFEAIRSLVDMPIEFWFVGPVQVEVPADLKQSNRVRFFGPVPRSETHTYYREADLMIFPTFSDGFGLTQLEAQAWQLPVVASKFCGEVVRHDENGILLREVSGLAIDQALRKCAGNASLMSRMARNSASPQCFSVESLSERLGPL